MPKWRGEYNPIDDPSLKDLQEGKDLEQILLRDLKEVAEELHFDVSFYGGRLTGPDYVFEQIADIREKMKALPKFEQEEMDKRIKNQERFIPAYVVDFFSQIVEETGRRNSRDPGNYDYWEDIRNDINFYLNGKEAVKYTEVAEDLAELIEKTVRYEKEPQAFAFDEQTETLHKKFAARSMSEMYRSFSGLDEENYVSLSDDGSAKEKNLADIDDLRARVDKLKKIIEKIKDQDIVSECQKVIEYFDKAVELMEFNERSIELIAGFRSQISEYQYILREGGELDKESLGDFYDQVSEYLDRAKNVGSSALIVLRNLLRNIRFLERGEYVFFTDDNWRETLRQAERTGNLSEAFKILGFDKPEFEKVKVRKAFREMSKRYHPDVNPDKSSDEAFKRLSAAYDTIARAMGWKKVV